MRTIMSKVAPEEDVKGKEEEDVKKDINVRSPSRDPCDSLQYAQGAVAERTSERARPQTPNVVPP